MKILAIGRNYADHAKEMKSSVPEEPIVFIKPDSAILRNNNPFFIPDFSQNVHYEVEIVVKIAKIGKNVEEKFAHRYYSEIALGIDFTARDIQQMCKEKGLPWEKAKGFDNSAAISEFFPISDFGDVQNLNFSLDLNQKRVQTGNTSEMIFTIDQLIAHVSKYFTLKIGDWIYTGTPSGVGKVSAGDRLLGKIEDRVLLDFDIK